MKARSPFAWQGSASVFVSDPRFTYRSHKGRGAAPASELHSLSRAPTSSINTETLAAKDKTRLIQRGNR